MEEINIQMIIRDMERRTVNCLFQLKVQAFNWLMILQLWSATVTLLMFSLKNDVSSYKHEVGTAV